MQGIRWVARTSATNWSVEHPLCGMDLMITLSLWLFALEHDDEPATEEELAMYNKLRMLVPGRRLVRGLWRQAQLDGRAAVGQHD